MAQLNGFKVQVKETYNRAVNETIENCFEDCFGGYGYEGGEYVAMVTLDEMPVNEIWAALDEMKTELESTFLEIGQELRLAMTITLI